MPARNAGIGILILSKSVLPQLAITRKYQNQVSYLQARIRGIRPERMRSEHMIGRVGFGVSLREWQNPMINTGGDYGQTPYPPALFVQDFGTWSQFRPVSPVEKCGAGCALKNRKVGEITRVNDPRCLHCGKRFDPKNRIQVFCKDGCRTYFHRLKRQALVPALAAAYGLGRDHALDVLEKSGITRVAAALQKLGYVYDGKRWEKPAHA
jgi:hypothetical protein